MTHISALPAFDLWNTLLVATDVMATSAASSAALNALQARRLNSLLASAARSSPLYKEILHSRQGANQLQDLPISHKADLMQQFDRWVTDPCLRLPELQRFVEDASRIADPFGGRYVVWESSGSSGEPGLFVQDGYAMAVYDALEALRRPVPAPWSSTLNPWGLGQRTAYIGATGGHFASIVSMRRIMRLNPCLASSLHCVSFLQPTRALMRELDAIQPNIIATYPSLALVLAEEHRAQGLRLRPQEIWTGGENLSTAARSFICDTFDCPVIDSYGASEFFSLACECRSGSLHLNSDWAILEPVDTNGNVLPAGEFGSTTLLTNLANHVQPLIRYDIGDRVMLHTQACTCGSHLPVITVLGRDDDTIHLGDESIAVLPLALCTVMEDDAQMFDFQIAQNGPSELLLRTGLCGDVALAGLDRARIALEAYLAHIGAKGVQILCRPDDPVQLGRSGKVRRVVATQESS